MLIPVLLHLLFGVFLFCFWFFSLSVWWVVLAFHILVVIMVYGSAYIGSGFYVKAFLRAKIRDKRVALTFDDGVHAEVTPKVLNTLKKYQICATFFVIGKNIETIENQAILKRIDAEGHHIGNHSFSHAFWFDFYPKKRVIEELRRVDEIVWRVIGKKNRWFRPPYGVTNPAIGAAVRFLGYDVMGWSVRSLDTVIKDPKQLLQRVMKKIRGGDIILLHDHLPHIVEFLPMFLDTLHANGYKVVPAEELLKQDF